MSIFLFGIKYDMIKSFPFSLRPVIYDYRAQQIHLQNIRRSRSFYSIY